VKIPESDEVVRMGDEVHHRDSARQSLLQRYEEVPPGLICDVLEQSGDDADKAIAMLWEMMPDAMERATRRLAQEEKALENRVDAKHLAHRMFRSSRGSAAQADAAPAVVGRARKQFEEVREIPGAPDWSPDALLRRERMVREAEDLREQAMKGINGGRAHMPRYLGDAALRTARAMNPHLSNYMSRSSGSTLLIHPCLPMPRDDGDTLEVDVHGLRKAEAESLVASLLEHATTTRGIGGKRWSAIAINTGQGTHSRKGVSVLRPALERLVVAVGLRVLPEDDNTGRFVVRL